MSKQTYLFICNKCEKNITVDRYIEDRNIPPESCECGSTEFTRSFAYGGIEYKQGRQKGNWNRYTTKVNGRSV